MAEHLELGKKGEELAEAFLVKSGYTILHRNWRYSFYELDIIAMKNGMLHIVEVKMRTSNEYGFPEESVTKKKIRSVLKAVDQYLVLHPQHVDFRLNVLSITHNGLSDPEYFLIEDVHL